MMLSFRSLVALAAIAFTAFAGPAQAGFPKELVAKHPCFKEVASPWDDPMAASKMPPAFQDWDTVYVGWWNEFDGSTKVCTAFLFSSVKANGDVSATYATAYPYKGEWQMNGSIKVEGGKQTLQIGNRATSFTYVMNEDGSLEVTSHQTGKKGVLYPASRVNGSVVAGAVNN
jgi:hypothetical protein